MVEFLTSTDFWAIVVKCLITALLSAGIGALCTLIGKVIIKCKNSKLVRHARIAVRAAEMKFPNEGKKMGPEKMAYVMDYLSVTFPKIKSNQYLYNIAEAAVYELNNQDVTEEAKQQFKDKYGELPDDLAAGNEDISISSKELESAQKAAEIKVEKEVKQVEQTTTFNLKSF